MEFLDLFPHFATTDGNLTGRGHSQPNPVATDPHDNDFDVLVNDNPLSDLASEHQHPSPPGTRFRRIHRADRRK
jgi:hypothetical protein